MIVELPKAPDVVSAWALPGDSPEHDIINPRLYIIIESADPKSADRTIHNDHPWPFLIDSNVSTKLWVVLTCCVRRDHLRVQLPRTPDGLLVLVTVAYIEHKHTSW